MTYYAYLGLALAVAGVGYFLRSRFARLGNGMIFAGCVGCVACIGWQLRENVFASAPSGPDRGQAVVGYFLANQLLRETSAQNGTVVLFFPPDNVMDEEAVGVYAGTFRRVLSGANSLKVETIVLPVSRKLAKSGNISLAILKQAASNAPSAIAYVSFAGVPPDIDQFNPFAATPKPLLLAFDPWRTTKWLSALKSGALRSVIVPRNGAQSLSNTQISGEPNEIFRQLYLMATPATADEISAQLK